MFYAHSHSSLSESGWQTLEEHHNCVSELAKSFALFGASATAGLLGRIHDTGKRSDSFQQRLHGKGGKVDHTSAAYLYLLQEWSKGSWAENGKALARLLA